MASLFSKPNTIVYVRRSGLIIAGKQIKPARLTFPAGVVANLEVVQPSKFVRGCQAFFEDNHVKGKRILMVLDESIVFDTVIQPQAEEQPAAIARAFTASMPYDAGKRACLYQPVADGIRLYGANYELFAAIAEALHGAGISRLVAITPAAAYDLSGPSQKLGTAVATFIADSAVRSNVNFNIVTPM